MQRILLVEKEIGRCFCNEECIYNYFQPVIDSLVEEHQKYRSKQDINQIERLRFEAYRKNALFDPDEIWVQITETGDHYYTHIKQINDESFQGWIVAISLMLEGEPSFILLDFISKDQEMINRYRKGTEVPIQKVEKVDLDEEISSEEIAEKLIENHVKSPSEEAQHKECLYRVQKLFLENRKPEDIPFHEYMHYDQYTESVLEDPDEIWVNREEFGLDARVFISRFVGDQKDSFYIISVCAPENIGDFQAIEVVMSIPTMDPQLVQKFRRGTNTLNKWLGVGFNIKQAA